MAEFLIYRLAPVPDSELWQWASTVTHSKDFYKSMRGKGINNSILENYEFADALNIDFGHYSA